MSEQQPPWPERQGQQPPYPGRPAPPPQAPPPAQPYVSQPPPQPYQGPPPQQPYPGQPYPGYLQQFPGYARPPKQPADSTARLIGWLILATGVIVAVSAWLTWGSVEGAGQTFEINGVTGSDVPGDDEGKDGIITLVLALPVIGFGLVRGFGRLPLTGAVIGLVLGLLITLVAVVDIVDINDSASTMPDGVEISIGIGLWLTLAAAIAMSVVSIAGLVKRR